MKEFADLLNANLILKGGTHEKDVSTEIGLDSVNIENVGVRKVNNHDPRQEVNLHYNQLIRLAWLFDIPYWY